MQIGVKLLGDRGDNRTVQAAAQRDTTHTIHSFSHCLYKEFLEDSGRLLQILRFREFVGKGLKGLHAALCAVDVSWRKFLDIELHVID